MGLTRCREIFAGYNREAGFELSQVTCRSSDPASQMSHAVYNNIIEYAGNKIAKDKMGRF